MRHISVVLPYSYLLCKKKCTFKHHIKGPFNIYQMDGPVQNGAGQALFLWKYLDGQELFLKYLVDGPEHIL